ncbi:MAG: class I SAM-dependent methyltransferase [Defluviitaleaceae bacterium]|nr:class I SAM-dependent methyltransferase [Defluviitaleaceae bacterium]
MDDYTIKNADAISKWAEDGWAWGVPVTKETCENARNGQWRVLLTPDTAVPHEWFPPLKGAKLLGLASGGGQQMPIFSLIGADCTVMDLSDKQLDSERVVAEREGYAINIVKADMTKPFPFENESFDLIFHPVSNVYIEDVHHVWRECYRVLKPGGVLLSGLDNGLIFAFHDYDNPLTVSEKLPYNPLKNPAQMAKLKADGEDSVQFSHGFNEQIGGQLKAGFVITAAYEDTDSTLYDGKAPDKIEAALKDAGISTYWATRAVKQL